MDDGDIEEPIYQYYTIENNSSDLIDLNDEFILPNAVESENLTENAISSNKQVLFLTFNDTEKNLSPNQSLLQIDPLIDESNEIPTTFNSNIKLITLEDGRMFMTTALKDTNNIIQPELLENDEFNSIQLSNDEESVDNLDSNYQFVELPDGSQTVLELYEIQTDSSKPDEEIAEVNVKKEKKFICDYEGCEKAYATSYHLSVHMRSHLGSKPFACNVEGCNKKFTTNYSLKAHLRTHTGEKPYGCGICNKHFKTSGDLLKHMRTHTGEKPFACPIKGCNKSFTTSNIRKVHIRSHTGERPFSCDFPDCGKAFSSSTNYKNHIRIHSGEKPYICSTEGCGKRFTEYSSLYKHNAVHQPARPYLCVFCGHRFKQESAMNVHKRLKHNVVVTKGGTEIMVDFE